MDKTNAIINDQMTIREIEKKLEQQYIKSIKQAHKKIQLMLQKAVKKKNNG